MARKLSRIARPRMAVVAVVGSLLVVHVAPAQESVQGSRPPTVIQNPFTTKISAEPATAAQPEQISPRPAPAPVYQNPFGANSVSPPFQMPLRPGPISRWQSMPAPQSSPSLISDAILAAAPTAISASRPTDPSSGAELSWDRLPPVDELRALKDVKTASAELPAGPPDPVSFAPNQLAQPVWMVPDLSQALPLSAPQDTRAETAMPTLVDPFEMHEGQSDDGLAVTATPKTSPAATSPSLFRSRPAGRVPAAADMLPVIVSDYVDSSNGWYDQAERAAQTARSVDELTTVTKLCKNGLQNSPTPQVADALGSLAAWAYNRRGEVSSDEGRFSQALADFQLAIESDPNCSLALHNRAVTLAQQDKRADALRDFNRVIELNPGLAVAYRNRAELLTSMGRIEDAMRDYDQALEQLTDDAALYCARANAWRRLGNSDRALDDLNQAIRVAPNDATTYGQRGDLAAERGNFSQAIRDLERAIQIDPNLAAAYCSLAWLRATCSDPQFQNPRQALSLAAKAVDVSAETNHMIFEALAAAHASSGDFAAAVEAETQAIAVAPAQNVAALRERLALYQQKQPYRSRHASAVRTAVYEGQSPAEGQHSDR